MVSITHLEIPIRNNVGLLLDCVPFVTSNQSDSCLIEIKAPNIIAYSLLLLAALAVITADVCLCR